MFFSKLYDENKGIDQLEEEFPEKSFVICKELQDMKLDKIKEQKRRQQLRINSHELHQLERQLQTAFMSQQLREQQITLAKQKKEDIRKKREENAKFADECENVRKTILHDEQEDKRKKEVFRRTIKSQIEDLQQKRRIEFENVIKDRNEMNILLKRFETDKLAERRKALLTCENLKKEIKESQCNRELEKKLEKDHKAYDIERNLAYQKECDDIKIKMAEEKRRIQKEKEALSERIGQHLSSLNKEKEKRENLLLSLLVEEQKAKEDQRYRKSLLKQVKEREKLRTEFENYQEIKIQREIQFKEEEEKFRKEHLRYLAERDKLDQLSDEKRRRKKMEHSKALKEFIERRRCEKANEIVMRIADFENTLSGQKERDLLIAQERIRILRAAPKDLLNYLPPGVLKPSDKKFLT